MGEWENGRWGPHPATRSLGLVDGRYFADPELQALLPAGSSPETLGLALFGLVLTAALVVGKVRGVLAYFLVRILTGRGGEISPTMWVLTALFILRFLV